MRTLPVLSALVLLVGLSLHSPFALAWGSMGHELQTEAAIALMNSPLKGLFQPNADDLNEMANVPDRSWKNGAGATYERPAHFFHWDFYKLSQISRDMPIPLQRAMDVLGASILNKNGTGLWRIDQIQALLVDAIRKGEWSRALQMAGVIGHYVGDLSQPMHVSSDYDGQSIGRPGVHKYFETTLLRREDRGQLLTAILQKASEPAPSTFRTYSSSTAMGVSFEDSKVAYGELPSVLRVFEEDDGASEDEKLMPMAITALARGAVTLAAVWDLAYAEAHPDHVPDETMTVRSPAWVPFRIRAGDPAPINQTPMPQINLH